MVHFTVDQYTLHLFRNKDKGAYIRRTSTVLKATEGVQGVGGGEGCLLEEEHEEDETKGTLLMALSSGHCFS